MVSDRSTQSLWLSYSGIHAFMHCPRAYFLRYLYKDPRTQHKITLISPALVLGQIVHNVLDEIASLKTEIRFDRSLVDRFNQQWQPVAGPKGGFKDHKEELHFKTRGQGIMRRLQDKPGPLAELAVRIKMDLPHYDLSSELGMVLCGRLDWLSYLPDRDAVSIIDFKTSTRPESADSLQLPVYVLLATHCQKRPVIGASYWYLETKAQPTAMPLPDTQAVTTQLITLGKQILLAKKLNRFTCPQPQGCLHCRPYEAILLGEAQFVGTNDRNQDVYTSAHSSGSVDDSEIL